jgi:hypothetical protein
VFAMLTSEIAKKVLPEEIIRESELWKTQRIPEMTEESGLIEQQSRDESPPTDTIEPSHRQRWARAQMQRHREKRQARGRKR